ncbi:MAG: LysR substrate-binding domain-containing protein [Paracoccaceae bacterium]
MDITLRQLRYFVALADERSFRRAAEKVNITQPALSLQIKELEVRLGTKLVERLPRDIRLTRSGEITLVRAQNLLTDMRELERSVRLQSGLDGQLLLGVIPTIAPYLLPAALTNIRARITTLEVRVHEAQTEVLMQALHRGTIDAAIISPPFDKDGFDQIDLFEDRFLLAGSREKLEQWGLSPGRPKPVDIPPDRLLMLDQGHCLADQALDICGMTRQQIDLGASSLGTLSGLVAEGLGITFLPEIALRAEAGNNRLSLLRFATPEPNRKIVLVRRSGGDSDEWFTELADILRNAGSELLGFARQHIAP